MSRQTRPVAPSPRLGGVPPRDALLATKLYVPPARPELVPRPRLIERLNAGLHRKLTLISAPAGFGKTTLLSEWAGGRVSESASGWPVAWLSLDEGDNDPARFLAYLVAALQTVQAEVGEAALAALQGPRIAGPRIPQPPPTESVLTALINEIAALPVPGDQEGHPYVLILDDYHLITAQPIHDGLTFLLDRLPPGMHLVIAGRADPPLPVARLRGQGQLSELRQSDLRFTPQEAATFLNDVMRLGLSPEDVAALEARTEGWIAGLQMAALAIQGALAPQGQFALQGRGAMRRQEDVGWRSGFVRAFTGSDRYILDYLVEEVLGRQPEEVQAFLLHTSILERLSGPLCDAVVGREQGSAIHEWDTNTRMEEERGSREQGGAIHEWGTNTRMEGEQWTVPCSPVTDYGSRITDYESRITDYELRITNHELRITDSQSILEYLERNNLFVVPLDNERRWYRYHRLFADLLRRRLQHKQPDLVSTYHRRAGEWFEWNGLTALAIEHLLRARDFERAAGLIERNAEATLMRSELATFLGWMDELPDELVRDRPSLCVFQAWALLLAGRPLDAVEARLQDAARVGADRDLPLPAVDKTAPLRALLALYRGEIPRAAELARRALERLPEDDLFLRDLAAWIGSLSQLADGDLAASAQALDQVARMSHRAGNVMIAVMVLCNIAGLRMQQGRLYQARDIYQQALEWATDERGQLLPIAGKALIGLGRLFYQWNDLERATRYLVEGIELAGRWGEAGAIEGTVILAQVRQAQGDVDGAREAIHKAQQLALKTDTTELDDILVAAHQAYLWVAQGDLEAASRWLEERGLTVDVALAELEARVSDDFIRSRRRRTAEYTTLVRVLLAQDRPDEALAVLKPLLAIAERWGLNERVIRFQILRALAFQAQNDVAQGMAALERALSLAEPAGYVRIFLDEGEPMQALLRKAVAQVGGNYASRLLACFGLQTAQPGVPQILHPKSEIVEPLSERESQVLQLLTSSLSIPEIADTLCVADSTVRSHVKSIYGKLGVHRRLDAIEQARKLNLL